MKQITAFIFFSLKFLELLGMFRLSFHLFFINPNNLEISQEALYFVDYGVVFSWIHKFWKSEVIYLHFAPVDVNMSAIFVWIVWNGFIIAWFRCAKPNFGNFRLICFLNLLMWIWARFWFGESETVSFSLEFDNYNLSIWKFGVNFVLTLVDVDIRLIFEWDLWNYAKILISAFIDWQREHYGGRCWILSHFFVILKHFYLHFVLNWIISWKSSLVVFFHDFTGNQFEMRCSKAIFGAFLSGIGSKYKDCRCVEIGKEDGGWCGRCGEGW